MTVHYTVDQMLRPLGNLFKCHEDVLSLQPMIPPKRFDIFFPCGMLRSRCVSSDFSFNYVVGDVIVRSLAYIRRSRRVLIFL